MNNTFKLLIFSILSLFAQNTFSQYVVAKIDTIAIFPKKINTLAFDNSKLWIGSEEGLYYNDSNKI